MYRFAQVITMIAFCALSITGLWGQQAILSSGSNGSGIGGTVSYSIGQVSYTQVISPAGEITLGVQQPNLVIVVGTQDLLPTISVELYPNPVNTTAILEIADTSMPFNLNECSFELYDISGRLLLHQQIINKSTHVPMSQYDNAIYFLKVRCQDVGIKTFKIFKTH